jgi:hypothetical protein
MNNLHRGLAPISEAAWSQIEEHDGRWGFRYPYRRGCVYRLPNA